MNKDKSTSAKKAKADSEERIKRKAIVTHVFNDGKLVVKSGTMTYVIWYRNIIKIAVDGKRENCIRINCKEGADIVIIRTLEEFLDELPDSDFMKVHKSFIVNILHVESFDKQKDSGVLNLSNELKAEVSKGHFDELDLRLERGAKVLDVKVVKFIKPKKRV